MFMFLKKYNLSNFEKEKKNQSVLPKCLEKKYCKKIMWRMLLLTTLSNDAFDFIYYYYYFQLKVA